MVCSCWRDGVRPAKKTTQRQNTAVNVPVDSAWAWSQCCRSLLVTPPIVLLTYLLTYYIAQWLNFRLIINNRSLNWSSKLFILWTSDGAEAISKWGARLRPTAGEGSEGPENAAGGYKYHLVSFCWTALSLNSQLNNNQLKPVNQSYV